VHKADKKFGSLEGPIPCFGRDYLSRTRSPTSIGYHAEIGRYWSNGMGIPGPLGSRL